MGDLARDCCTVALNCSYGSPAEEAVVVGEMRRLWTPHENERDLLTVARVPLYGSPAPSPSHAKKRRGLWSAHDLAWRSNGGSDKWFIGQNGARCNGEPWGVWGLGATPHGHQELTFLL
jgi:hypothetical protein